MDAYKCNPSARYLPTQVGGTATALAKRGVYMACHLAFGVVSMSLATVYWRTQWGHLAFLVTILTSTFLLHPAA